MKPISNKIKYGCIIVTVLSLLTGGYLWHHERSPGVRLAEFCDGALPVEDLLEVTNTTSSGFTGDDLGELHSADFGRMGRLGTVCRLNYPHSFQVSIEAAEQSNPYFTYLFQRGDDVLPVPLGNGWSGFLVPSGSTPSDKGIGGSVVLDCPGWKNGQGEGIIVTGDWGNVTGRAPLVRMRLAKILTYAAQRTAEKTGCKAKLGSPIQNVDPAVTRTEEADQATGTCAGMASRSTVWETAARTAPVEYCVLKDGVRLTAFYGAFADSDFDELRADRDSHPSGQNNSVVWGTAQCSGSRVIAHYSASPEEGGARADLTEKPLTAREFDDLRTFATRSSKRNGCTDLRLPSAPAK